jgi:hypothetical protein
VSWPFSNFIQVGQHHRHGFVPPRQPAQVGLLARVVEAGQVQAGQHVADPGAMGRCGRKLAMAAQLVHHGGRLALEAMQQIALGVRRRVGHGNATRRQVLHQVQVKRQLLEAQAFKQRQHILALVGIDKVIGVFDAA